MRWFRRKTCLTSRKTNCLSPYCRQQETTSGNNESGADCTENLTDTARKPENNFHKENTSCFSMKISTLQEAASCLPRSSSLHGQMLLFAHSIATSCRRAEKRLAHSMKKLERTMTARSIDAENCRERQETPEYSDFLSLRP